MQRLNLPEYEFRIKTDNGKTQIYDQVRRKFVSLTPEEWVRQNFIEYLKNEKNYPISLMAVEKKVLVNNLARRFDLLMYSRSRIPLLVVEFKAPEVKITQETFDQVVRYNMGLKVIYIAVSNGLQHFICRMDYETNGYTYLTEIPDFVR